ncbi:MAG: isoamylase early set domain-containing protein [Candidatus Promineifilaceae bacterium]|nr:isoamylase early set domain-containing protein [Candidatus Promineifilaceae bacterium]
MLKKRFFKTIDECEVSFKVEPEDAESVALVIETNDWEPIPMKQLKSGPFKTTLRLPLDRQIQFRYLIDGETWENDETADAYVPNKFGSSNSVVDTTRDEDA